MISVRPAQPADSLAVATFQTEVWNEAYRGLVPPDYLERTTIAVREQRWRGRITGERDVAVAEGVDGVVGVVSWRGSELMTLYVAATERGTGLGLRLLEWAIGDDPAYLWVFAGNSWARAFYAKHRFVADGDEQIDPDTGLRELRYSRGVPGAERTLRTH